MRRYQLSLEKAKILRQQFIDGEYHSHQLAKKLRISTTTTWRYKREFEKIRAYYPDKLNDFGFYPSEPERAHGSMPKYSQFLLIIPALLAEEKTPTIEPGRVWKKYVAHSTEPYAFPTFKPMLFKWLQDNVIATPQKLLDRINRKDIATLKTWRNSNNHRFWQIAKSLEMAQKGASRKQIIDAVETSYKTLGQWIEGYKKKGLKAFDFAPNPRNQKSAKAIKERKEKLLRLLHESPKLYGLNRTSWSLTALILQSFPLFIFPPPVAYEL